MARNIQSKIIRVSIAAVALGIFTTSGAFIFYVESLVRSQALEDGRSHLHSLTQQTAHILDSVRQYSLTIAISDEVQQVLTTSRSGRDYRYYADVQDISNALTRYALLRDDIIDSITVVDAQGSVYRMDGLHEAMPTEQWYLDIGRHPELAGFSAPHQIQNQAQFPTMVDTVSYVQDIYSRQFPRQYLGKLVVHLHYDALFLHFGERGFHMNDFAVVNGIGELVYHRTSLDAADLASLPEGQAGGNAFYTVSSSLEEFGWQFYGFISRRNLWKSFLRNAAFFLPVIAGSLLLTLLITVPVTKGITGPLMALIKGMRQVSEGDLHAQVQVAGDGEIQQAARVFNHMVTALDGHLQETIAYEGRKKELEMKIMISQINPHFIYNTLNTIIYLSREIHADNIILLTRNFIRILQNTVKTDPNALTTVEQEQSFIESYITLLRFRYDDLVDLVWDIDPEATGLLLPRMLIYPLVENSIYHGILPTRRKGEITIRIRRESGAACVSVKDTGVGIPPDRLEGLRGQLRDPEAFWSAEHIGLINASHRLRLLYGDTDPIAVLSREQEGGTEIFFRVPQ